MAAAALQATCFSSLLALGVIALQDGTLLQSGASIVYDLAPARSGEEADDCEDTSGVAKSWLCDDASHNPYKCNFGSLEDTDFTFSEMCCACGGGLTATAPTPDVVSGTGDPHLRNLRGENFDVYQQGNLALLHVPRFSEPARTLLLVEADAKHMGDACSVYFQVVTISGMWTNQTRPIRFLAQAKGGTPDGGSWKEWMRFGPIDLKVTLRKKGVKYINVYARNVAHGGYEVGGLLGLDDHEAIARRPQECTHRHAAVLTSSIADVS